ncbi:MAG TPA: hypothetical protein VFT12_03375 [Thermoanaerobaculia bacterium]|nr:hypothetical protein [Thermoanaerobaculia bacterium]
MRNLILAAALLSAGCTAPAPMPAPSTPPPIPPPVPERLVLHAIVTGQVREPARNSPAAFALVSAAASPACETGGGAQVFADERGEFSFPVEAGPGPEMRLCVAVEATLGGASGRVVLRDVPLRTSDPERIRADIQLERIPPLTESGARALIDAFVQMLNGTEPQIPLSTYVVGGPEALRTAREDYQSLLGSNITATVTGWKSSSFDQHLTAELGGSKGNAISLSVYQDYVGSLHSPLLDYSLRSRHYIASFSRLVGSGDAEGLARLLTEDDLDVPVEDARRVIDRYRPAFEVRGGAYELIAVDERRNTLTYRVTWRGDGVEKSADVVLGYGDGLLGLRE